MRRGRVPDRTVAKLFERERELREQLVRALARLLFEKEQQEGEIARRREVARWTS